METARASTTAMRDLMNARFTIDGSDALEDHLARVCESAAEGVLNIVGKARLEALVLGGGYGRGEGGVLTTPASVSADGFPGTI